MNLSSNNQLSSVLPLEALAVTTTLGRWPRVPPNQVSPRHHTSPWLPKHLHINTSQLISCHASTCQLSPVLDWETQCRARAVLVTTVSPTPSSSGPDQAGVWFVVCFFFLSFCYFSWAAPAAYGGSQARGLIGAVAAGLHQSHSNLGSELHLRPTPQLTATPDP